jgi:hypothetical protein
MFWIGGEADWYRFNGSNLQRFNEPGANTARPARTASFPDPMFEFPDAKGGEEEGFGAGKGAGCGHDMFAVMMAIGAGAWTPCLFLGFNLSQGLGGRAGDEVVTAVHNYCINCNYQHI